jgi:tetratricopeptide (TPR) repeat protein
MKLAYWRTQGRTTRFLITVAGAVAVFACARVSMALQNPVDLDKALQQKPVQDRAQSYYHFALSKWYDKDGDMAKALPEMQAAVRYNENDPSVHVALADLLSRMDRVNEAMDEAKQASPRLDLKDAESHWLLATVYLRATDEGRGRQAAPDNLKLAVKELEMMKAAAPDDPRADFALGGCYMELGQPEKAIAAYERWQTLEPDEDQGYVAIAQYFEHQGNQDKAIQYLEKAIASQPDSVQDLSMLASLYEKAKREKDAIPIYRKIVELTGGNPVARKQLASALLNADEFDEAAKLLGELSKDNPHDTSIQVLMGRIQMGARQFPEAIETLKSVVASNPGDIEAEFYLGTAYELGGRAAEAVKIFSDLLDQSKDGPEDLKANRGVFQQHLAASYQDMGDGEKAIAIYEEMVKSDPSPRTCFLLINAYRVDRQLDKALSFGKQQFEKNPKDDDLALVYARTLADSGKTKEGAEILDKKLQGSPSNLDIYINLSQIYVQAKRFSEAEKILRRAEEQNLDKDRVRFQLASVYERQKDFDRAESLFKEILKEHPKDAPTLNYIGYMLADRGIRLNEAVEYVERALALEPNNPAYLDSLGWAFFKMNDLQKAQKYLLQAVEMEKKDPVIQDHVGDLYFKIGNLERAQEFWKKSLSNGGEPEDAQKVREKLGKVQKTLRKQERGSCAFSRFFILPAPTRGERSESPAIP